MNVSRRAPEGVHYSKSGSGEFEFSFEPEPQSVCLEQLWPVLRGICRNWAGSLDTLEDCIDLLEFKYEQNAATPTGFTINRALEQASRCVQQRCDCEVKERMAVTGFVDNYVLPDIPTGAWAVQLYDRTHSLVEPSFMTLDDLLMNAGPLSVNTWQGVRLWGNNVEFTASFDTNKGQRSVKARAMSDKHLKAFQTLAHKCFTQANHENLAWLCSQAELPLLEAVSGVLGNAGLSQPTCCVSLLDKLGALADSDDSDVVELVLKMLPSWSEGFDELVETCRAIQTQTV